MYRSQIVRGLQYLTAVQNPDGGIPATRRGDTSGCWTSAESLEAFVTSATYPLDRRYFAVKMMDFLQRNQIRAQGPDYGGWPLVVGSRCASSMATGHAVAGLRAMARYFVEDQQIVAVVHEMIADGVDWLVGAQGDDGGWGAEPAAGRSGSDPRMIATVYALRGLLAEGRTITNSRPVREASAWIVSLVNNDGGFGGHRGAPSDACNTARAVTSLIRSGYSERDSATVRNAVRYILHSKPRQQLWPLDTETYVTDMAPGQTVFNSNTTADVLEALILTRPRSTEIGELLRWFVLHQDDVGSWALGANDHRVGELVTWPTNEAIWALSVADEHFDIPREPTTERERISRWLFYSAVAATVLEGLLLLGAPRAATDTWNRIPDAARNIIVFSLLVAVMVNLVSSFLYDTVRRHLKPRQRTT